MKFLIKTLFFFLLSMAFFTSCQKENIDEVIISDPNYEPDETKVNTLFRALKTDNISSTARMNCINIHYPVRLELKSGNTLSVGSNSELEAALSATFTDQVIDFVFPLRITDASGNVKEVTSNEELGRNFASCVPQTGWAAAMSTNETLPACLYGGLFCFDVIYPVSLIDDNGNTSTVANEIALIDLFATNDSHLSFILPISVEDENGIQSSINNIDDFFSLIAQCKDLTALVVIEGFQFQGFVCYDLVYPATMQDINGNNINVNNADEYALLVLDGEPLQLLLPFSIVDSDGVTTLITGLQDYILALRDCGLDIEIIESGICDFPSHVLLFINRGGSSMSPCRFQINYPVQLVARGTTYTVNNLVQYYGVYNQFQLYEIEVVFPVSVTVNSTSQVIQFNAKPELCQYIDDCN